MSADGTGADVVNAYRVEDTYYFRHYFDEDAVFDKLKPHYQPYDYRFEVPANRFPEIKDFLEGRGYHLREVEDPAALAVVVRKFTDHPEVVFDESVIQTGVNRFNVFLMKDRASADRAIAAGARPLSDTDLTLTL
ncbi:MAG: hypothetical protein ABEJ57_06075 [Halobacteriaceae archaeon]